MKLKEYIFSSIFHYPSLYYCKKFEESKKRVLNQLFLVIGSGVEFKNGYFKCSDDKKSISIKDEQRILFCERIGIISKIDTKDKRLTDLGIVFSELGTKEQNLFYSDFINLKGKYLELYQKIDPKKVNFKNFSGVVDFFPKEKEDYEFHPYPFNLEYCPFWNEKTNSFIPKSKIQQDWVEGIIWIFKETLKWFEDDNKFLNDKYFNWCKFLNENNQFVKLYEKARIKGDGKKYNWDFIHKLCKDYGLEPKNYGTSYLIAQDICTKSRKKYIEDCKLVIDFYSKKD